MKPFRSLLVVVGLLAAVCGAQAQTFRGRITGTVSDATGAVVPGAKVTIRNVDTGLERTTETDETGFFVVAEVSIGNYSVTVEKQGFQTAIATGIRVEVAVERRVDITLQPGAMEQTIEVVATVPLVETTTNVLGGTLQRGQVENLPLERDFTKLLVLVPGVTAAPDGVQAFPGSMGAFSVNGNRDRSNNFLLDGTDMNDGYRNLPAINQPGVWGTPATLLSLETIAEVRVLSNFEPEFGRNGGSVMNIVTKSGTNELHGSVYEFFRNDRLNARNFFNNVGPKDKFRNNNFGAALGGPIRRNQTFFFGSYEGQRESGAITSLNPVPTPTDFATAITNIGGPGNINPIIQNFINLCASTGKCSGGTSIWPAPTPGREGLTLNSVVPSPFRNRLESFIAKIDHNFNERNLLTGRFFFGDSNQSFPLALSGGNNLPGNNTEHRQRTQLVSLSYVHVFSPIRVNELRFGYNRNSQWNLADDRGVFGNPADSLGLNTGITRKANFGLPTIFVGGFSQLGGSPFANPRRRWTTTWHAIDNYSWKSGRHDFKFGFEFRRTFVASIFDLSQRGALDFGSLEDFLLGDVSGGWIVVGDTQRGSFQNNYAGYLHDSFRVSSRFTFNWGLRYDFYGVLDEEANRFSRYDPAAGLVLLGSPGFPRLYDRDWNNFGPRVSFAWDPWGNGKTVIRAGWGFFYDAFSQDFFVAQIPWNTFNTGAAHNPVGPSPVFISFSPVSPLAEGVAVFDPTSFSGDTTDIGQVDPKLRTPYIQNYNLNIQRQLWTNTMLQVGYVGSAGRKLFRTREINASPVPGGPRPFDTGAELGGATAPGTFPFIVNQFESSARSIYHSLQVSLNQRNWHGWTQQVSWTWGHAIDTASDGAEQTPNLSTPDNNHNPNAERANSSFDTRHRFVWNWIYDIPKFGDNKLAQGWQLSGILTLMSGQPFHINFTSDFDGDGFWDFVARPDIVGNPFLGRREPDRYLNLAAFKVPCDLDPLGDGTSSSCIGNLHYGSLPRNAFTGPNFKNFNLAITKTTAITERVKIQFRADFYNLTNHANFGNPLMPAFIAPAGFQGIDPVTGRGGAAGTGCTTTATDPNCFLPIIGTPDTVIGYPSLGGGGPRNIQFAVKLLF